MVSISTSRGDRYGYLLRQCCYWKWFRRVTVSLLMVGIIVGWQSAQIELYANVHEVLEPAKVHGGIRISSPINPWQAVSNRNWCRTTKDDTPGLIYVKIPKTASSTMVGINIRIATKVGGRKRAASPWWPFEHTKPRTCSFSFRHGRSEMLQRESPYLLWSFIREPASRALSEFYHFEVSRQGRRPSDLWAKAHLQKRRNYQFLYLADHGRPQSLLQTECITTNECIRDIISKHILEPYDFIGLLERRMESLAIMKLLWDLKTNDLIVLSAKMSGGYDDGRYNGSCVQIQQPPKPSSPFLRDYIATDFQKHNIDYNLYELVNRTLDETIVRLGVDVVAREVQEIQTLQAFAESKCQSRAIFPCSSNGTLQMEASAKDCYWTDSGCGHMCVDEALDYGRI